MPDPLPDAYGKLRPVYAFVMVLGYSRLLTVVFSLRTRLVDFLRCCAEALAFFGGVPTRFAAKKERLAKSPPGAAWQDSGLPPSVFGRQFNSAAISP